MPAHYQIECSSCHGRNQAWLVSIDLFVADGPTRMMDEINLLLLGECIVILKDFGLDVEVNDVVESHEVGYHYLPLHEGDLHLGAVLVAA